MAMRAASFFNALTGGSELDSMKNLTIAPFHMRERVDGAY